MVSTHTSLSIAYAHLPPIWAKEIWNKVHIPLPILPSLQSVWSPPLTRIPLSKLRLQGNTFARLTHLSSFLRADGLMQWLVLSRSHSPTTWMPNTMALFLLEQPRSYLRLSLTSAQAIFGFQAKVTSLTLLVFFTTNTTLVDPHLTRLMAPNSR